MNKNEKSLKVQSIKGLFNSVPVSKIVRLLNFLWICSEIETSWNCVIDFSNTVQVATLFYSYYKPLLLIKLKNIVGNSLSLKTNVKLRIQVCYNLYYFQFTEKTHFEINNKRKELLTFTCLWPTNASRMLNSV